MLPFSVVAFILQSVALWWAFSLVLPLSSYVTGVTKFGTVPSSSGKACPFGRSGGRMETWTRQLSQPNPGSVKTASCLPRSLPPPDLGSVRPERRVTRSSQTEWLPGWAPSQRGQGVLQPSPLGRGPWSPLITRSTPAFLPL